MELSKAIRTGYYQALSGMVFHNGLEVPVYDVYAVPERADYPYILLSSQTSIQGGLKRCKMYTATIVVDVVTGSRRPIGRDDAEDIAEQVEDIVNPDSFEDLDISMYGYSIGNTSRGSDTDLSSKNNTYYIFRKVMRYDHIVSKSNN